MYQPSVAELRTLVGNPDLYALQQTDGAYRRIDQPLTTDVLKLHRAGEMTVGTYTSRVDDGIVVSRTLVWDIDSADEMEQFDMLQGVETIVISLDLAYGVEESGRKGYHIWVRTAEWMPAATLQRLGKGVAAEAGFPSMEVFPKQGTLKDVGSLIKLPGGVHRVTDKPNYFIPNPGFPMSVAVEQIVAAADKYPEVVARKMKGEAASIEYPCVYGIQEDGVQEGGRNNHLFHLATMLRRGGLTEDNVALIIEATNAKGGDPLDDFEVEQLLESSLNSGPICDRLNDDVHCGQLCLKNRHPGLYTHPGRLTNAAEGETVTVEVAKRTNEGLTLHLDHPDLVDGRVTLKRRSRTKE